MAPTKWFSYGLHHSQKHPSLFIKYHNNRGTKPYTIITHKSLNTMAIRVLKTESQLSRIENKRNTVLSHRERMGQLSPAWLPDPVCLLPCKQPTASSLHGGIHCVIQSLFHNKALIITPICEQELHFHPKNTSTQL